MISFRRGRLCTPLCALTPLPRPKFIPIPYKMVVTQKDSIGILALLFLHDFGDGVWLSPNSTDEYRQLGMKAFSAGILEQSKEAGNRVGIRLSYRPATLLQGLLKMKLSSGKLQF
jgi:hypothetical protein